MAPKVIITSSNDRCELEIRALFEARRNVICVQCICNNVLKLLADLHEVQPLFLGCITFVAETLQFLVGSVKFSIDLRLDLTRDCQLSNLTSASATVSKIC